MTAYVHIGTVKTGTTTIQNFLYLNRKQLLKQKFHHPHVFDQRGYWLIVPALNNLRNDLDSQMLQDKLFNFQKDLAMDKKNIISSEALSHRLISLEDIRFFYQFLQKIGFSKIYILVYFRDMLDVLGGLFNTQIKLGYDTTLALQIAELHQEGRDICNYQQILKNWGEVFGRENLIVRLFDKNEFYQGDLLKDFIHSIGLEWDDEFIIPPNRNESLDLLGVELLKRIHRCLLPFLTKGNKDIARRDLRLFCEKHFTSKDSHLKFQPPKEVAQSYIDYFEESNEWVRKEFFPHKERLFPKKDLTNYKENYELKEMKPEYWDRIAEFIADIVKTKNQAIQNKDNQIISTNNEKQKLIDEKSNLQTQINQLQNTLNTLPIKKQQLEISNLEQDLINKKLNAKETNQNILIKELEIKKLEQELNINQAFSYIPKEQSAKQRVHDHLSYKLGQAMIVNSKSILGYIRMPFVLSYIHDKHKQEQKIYQEKIKKDPSLKLPPLESYPDYKEALKEKECLTYKLGEALIKASNNWYGGGYIKLLLEIRKLKREFRKKANHA